MDIWTLRLACRGHNRATVLEAVNRALQRDGEEQSARAGAAALVTAWLLDDQASQGDAPPLTSTEVASVARRLRRQVH